MINSIFNIISKRIWKSDLGFRFTFFGSTQISLICNPVYAQEDITNPVYGEEDITSTGLRVSLGESRVVAPARWRPPVCKKLKIMTTTR